MAWLNSILLFSFVMFFSGWGVWFLAGELRTNIQLGTAVDRTLSRVDKADNPRLYWLQVAGFVLLIGLCALIFISMALGLVVSVIRSL